MGIKMEAVGVRAGGGPLMWRAVAGALGFLTRLPVGNDSDSWHAFRTTPVAFPLVGYAVGILVAVPLALPLPAPVAAFLFPVWLYLLTGITHADGLADLGDAMVAHGDADRRLSVMRDTTVGVGAVLLIVLAVAGLVLAGLALAGEVPTDSVVIGNTAFGGFWSAIAVLGIVVAAEVGAKLAMVVLVCAGTATHDGMAAELLGEATHRDAVLPVLLALPAAALTWPNPAAAVALGAALLGAVPVWLWSRRTLGGISGDVIGASNEIARLVGLHAGVIVWTLW